MQNPIPVIIERSDKAFYARIADIGNFLPVTYGDTIAETEENMRELITDYLANEGKNDAAWQNMHPQSIEFTYTYDVQAFFEVFPALKITEIAHLAGLNTSLLRQYASGAKYPSQAQAQRIEQAIHTLGEQLAKVSVV
jgi:predicted RNase H-like HicB family nuclease